MLKKILGIIVMITIIAVGFFQKEAWLDAIKAGGLFSV
ncbi:TVP38/TMEM64 family protein, partial [Bacillus spizizenii]|nr:TVP38/TMEM64 family protein [Bacillus spizizenii]